MTTDEQVEAAKLAAKAIVAAGIAEALERAATVVDARQAYHNLAKLSSATPTTEKLLAQECHSIATRIRALKPKPEQETRG